MFKSKKIHILLLSLIFTSSMQAITFDNVSEWMNKWLGTVLTAVSTAIITNFLLEKYVKPAIMAPPAAQHIDVFTLPVAQAQFADAKHKLKNASILVGSKHEDISTLLHMIEDPLIYSGSKQIRSIILYGQSGVGKSSYAHAISDAIEKSVLWECSGKNIQKCTADHIHAMFSFARRISADKSSNSRFVIFMDDMHLFNPAQTDSKKESARKKEILAAISHELEECKNGHILFVGATQSPKSEFEFAKFYAKSIDRHIVMHLPSEAERLAALRLWTQSQSKKITEAMIQEIAKKTDKLTYRELKEFFEKVMISTIRGNKSCVEIQDIEKIRIQQPA